MSQCGMLKCSNECMTSHVVCMHCHGDGTGPWFGLSENGKQTVRKRFNQQIIAAKEDAIKAKAAPKLMDSIKKSLSGEHTLYVPDRCFECGVDIGGMKWSVTNDGHIAALGCECGATVMSVTVDRLLEHVNHITPFPTEIRSKPLQTGDCEEDCQDACAYPGQFSECAIGAEAARDEARFDMQVSPLREDQT